MMLKTDNGFFEYNGSLEIERKVRLFDELESASGDFSYSDTMPLTTHNLSIIQLHSFNTSGKIIYNDISCEILNDSGNSIYRGSIRIEKVRRTGQDKGIDFSFFSGNNNWISLLPNQLRDVDFSEYDQEFTVANVEASFNETSGLYYPIINTGAVTTRSYPNWKLEDFQPFLYVKDIIRKVFNRAGLKLTGSILKEWRYNRLITANNDDSVPQDEMNDRKARVSKSTTQTINPLPTVATVVTFPVFTGDYYPGDLWNTVSHRFTADCRMIVDITINADTLISANDFLTIQVYKSGSPLGVSVNWGGSGSGSTGGYASATFEDVELANGEYIDFRATVDTDPADILSASVTITPKKLYKTFGRQIVPDWSGQEMIYNFLSPFNPIITYNPYTKTVNIDLFKDIPHKEPIDISEYTSEVEEDYTEFINNYGKINQLNYSDSSENEAARYNRNNTVKYGCGEIDSGNDYVQPTASILSLDVATVFEDEKNPLATYLPKLSWRELDEDYETTATITNSAGNALFTIASGHEFILHDVVRITDSTEESYNGEWVISSVTSTTFLLRGVGYNGNATATATRLVIENNVDTDQILLLALPDLNITDFSESSQMFIDDEVVSTTSGTAYFYRPLQGKAVDVYKDSLAFQAINIPNVYQKTLITDYWRDTEAILQDPVKIFAKSNLPASIFAAMDFTRPVKLSVEHGQALFYQNRISGYQESWLPCIVELIKLR